MPDLVQEKLRAILMDHGRRVIDDPARLEALLRDHCGERRREVSALLSALREGVPASLSSDPATVPREALVATLARRLHENQGLTDDLARWAVATWAFALGHGEPRPATAKSDVERTPVHAERPAPRAIPRLTRPQAIWVVAGVVVLGLWLSFASKSRTPQGSTASFDSASTSGLSTLEYYDRLFIDQGYRQIGRTKSGAIWHGESESLTVTPQGAESTLVLGVCKPIKCTTWHLELFDASGTRLDSAKSGLGGEVILDNATPESESYSIRITMQWCAVAPCWYGLAVYEK